MLFIGSTKTCIPEKSILRVKFIILDRLFICLLSRSVTYFECRFHSERSDIWIL